MSNDSNPVVGATVQIRIVRGGTIVTFQPLVQSIHGPTNMSDDMGNYISEEFVIPGDFSAETLGREIVASVVAARLGK